MSAKNTTKRPPEWSSAHDRCLARLTRKFQSLVDLKFPPSDDCTGANSGYDDLVTSGFAVVRRTPIKNNGIACGENVEFALAAKGRR